MKLARPDLAPDPTDHREAMLAQQAAIREAATFEDELASATRIGAVDQAFTDDHVVSCAVVLDDGDVIATNVARRAVEFPYVPGLLSFREAGGVLAACGGLSVTPDVLLVDGNGRLHFRQAGLATHVGVVLAVPTVGVAKRLLCGFLCNPPPRPFETGTRVPIRAGEALEAAPGTVLGYAVQTRQWDRPGQSINPVYVSPGHRVAAETAADIALEGCRGYKLPEPIREADRRASDAATETAADR